MKICKILTLYARTYHICLITKKGVHHDNFETHLFHIFDTLWIWGKREVQFYKNNPGWEIQGEKLCNH